MSDAEAIQVVHGMMAAREREAAKTAALAPQVVTERNDPGATRRAFWKEVAVYPLTLACVAAYALLLAAAQ